MLQRVKIKNFRCLKNVEFELEPLTILVGPNASGKSAVLDALKPKSWGGEKNRWQYSSQRIRFEFGNVIGDSYRYDERRKSTREGKYRYEKSTYQKLQLDLDKLRQRNVAEEADQLDSDGGNLTNVFSTLTRDQQIELRDEFCKLVPVYSDINVRPVKKGKLQLEFQDRWNEEVTYQPSQVSDGTMLMLGYLLLQYQEKAPDVVAVEEPERGLHPYLLEQLVSFFRELANGERGPRSFNMVLATHSAELLDFARPEEVRFLDRDSKTGETTVEAAPTDDEGWEETMETYLDSLGNAWLSGGLGGVPGR